MAGAPAGDGGAFVPATRADVGVVAGFMGALRAEDPFPPAAADDATARAAVERLLADPALGRAWVIRSGDEPAGYVVLTLGYSIEFGGRTAFVDELYVAPAHRRRGIGRLALRFAAHQAAVLGGRGLFLEVSPANSGARRLYEAAGFVERKYRLMTQTITSST